MLLILFPSGILLVLNETNSAEINASFEGTFTVRVAGSAQENVFSYTNTTVNKSQYDFCMSPSTESFIVDTSIKLAKNRLC